MSAAICNGLVIVFFILAAVAWFGVWARAAWRATQDEWDQALTLLRAEQDRADRPFDWERDGA